MPRVALRDDGCGCVGTSRFTVGVGLDEGCATGEPPVVPVLRQFQLRERIREGYSADGNPLHIWQTIAEGGSIVAEERREFDADAGATKVSGKVTMANLLSLVPAQVKESAVLFEGDILWRITKSQVTPDVLMFWIDRNDGGA